MSENSKENFEKKWKIKNNFRKLLENLSNYYHNIASLQNNLHLLKYFMIEISIILL